MLAGLIAFADTIPYIRDIFRGSTRPHRGTWLIWSVLAIVVCLSQRADGASSEPAHGRRAKRQPDKSLVFLLAIRHGEGGVSTPDLVLIAIAGGGVAGWIVADEPMVATICVVAADLIGVGLMLPKTYRDPGSETLSTFAFASLGGALAAGAVGVVDVSLLMYPIYYFAANAAIALVIVQRRRTLARSGHPGSPPGWAAAGS